MAKAVFTEEFWRDRFTINEKDETALQEYFLQESKPLTTEAIARHLMYRLLDQQGRSGGGGSGYHPAAQYEVGDELTFPALDDASGKVVAVRDGENDRYGPFRVIEVQFNGSDSTREFASEFADLDNRYAGGGDEPPMSHEEAVELFQPYAEETVEATLENSDAFVQFGAYWLPRLMLVNFHEGHCNIAEAMVDITGEPMPTGDLLTEIPVEEQANDTIKRFSLNHALGQDERFVNSGTAEEPLWFLKRLQ